MFLHALATAVPPARYTQAACWDIVQRSPVRQRLSKRSRLILHSILAGDLAKLQRDVQLMCAFKTGAKYMNHRALSICKSRLAVAWTAVFLFVIQVVHSETSFLNGMI